jgi:Rod binding domain-containing protein
MSSMTIQGAARQFESLLIGQMLHAAREDDSSESSNCATDYAEQQFATVLAESGGLGIGDMIAKGLAKKS